MTKLAAMVINREQTKAMLDVVEGEITYTIQHEYENENPASDFATILAKLIKLQNQRRVLQERLEKVRV